MAGRAVTCLCVCHLQRKNEGHVKWQKDRHMFGQKNKQITYKQHGNIIWHIFITSLQSMWHCNPTGVCYIHECNTCDTMMHAN